MTVNGSEANDESPSPQFFIYRPEYSQFGDHVRGAGRWLVTDALAFTGELIATFEDGTLARSSIGTQLIHSPLFTTSIESPALDASDNELLDIWWDYQITRKYAVQLHPQWDFNKNPSDPRGCGPHPQLPRFRSRAGGQYDRIRDDTTFSQLDRPGRVLRHDAFLSSTSSRPASFHHAMAILTVLVWSFSYVHIIWLAERDAAADGRAALRLLCAGGDRAADVAAAEAPRPERAAMGPDPRHRDRGPGYYLAALVDAG